MNNGSLPANEDDPLRSIPGAQGDVARAALEAAFGTRAIGAISPVGGGITTALTFKIQAGDRNCLLRGEGEPSPLRNPYQYQSMRIASEAGIAPKIHHIDETVRVVVMDFLEEQAFADSP